MVIVHGIFRVNYCIIIHPDMMGISGIWDVMGDMYILYYIYNIIDLRLYIILYI